MLLNTCERLPLCQPHNSCKPAAAHAVTTIQRQAAVLTSPTTDAAKPAMAMRPTNTSLSLVKPISKPARLEELLLLLLLVEAFWLILGACRRQQQ
jgi:hypothetical protein